MKNLFIDKRGFRIARFQMLNWGNFENNMPQTFNFYDIMNLLVGESGTGKSTFVDALSYIFLPSINGNRFNIAAGSQRQLCEYVSGRYSAEPKDCHRGANADSYVTILLAVMACGSGFFTAGAVLRFKDSSSLTNANIARYYFIVNEPLSLQDDIFQCNMDFKPRLKARGATIYQEQEDYMIGFYGRIGVSPLAATLFVKLMREKGIKNFSELIREYLFDGLEIIDKRLKILKKNIGEQIDSSVNISVHETISSGYKKLVAVKEDYDRAIQGISDIQESKALVEGCVDHLLCERYGHLLESFSNILQLLDKDIQELTDQEGTLSSRRDAIIIELGSSEVQQSVIRVNHEIQQLREQLVNTKSERQRAFELLPSLQMQQPTSDKEYQSLKESLQEKKMSEEKLLGEFDEKIALTEQGRKEKKVTLDSVKKSIDLLTHANTLISDDMMRCKRYLLDMLKVRGHILADSEMFYLAEAVSFPDEVIDNYKLLSFVNGVYDRYFRVLAISAAYKDAVCGIIQDPASQLCTNGQPLEIVFVYNTSALTYEKRGDILDMMMFNKSLNVDWIKEHVSSCWPDFYICSSREQYDDYVKSKRSCFFNGAYWHEDDAERHIYVHETDNQEDKILFGWNIQSRLRRLEEKRYILQDAYDKLSDDCTKMRVERSTAQRSIERIQTTLDRCHGYEYSRFDVTSIEKTLQQKEERKRQYEHSDEYKRTELLNKEKDALKKQLEELSYKLSRKKVDKESYEKKDSAVRSMQKTVKPLDAATLYQRQRAVLDVVAQRFAKDDEMLLNSDYRRRITNEIRRFFDENIKGIEENIKVIKTTCKKAVSSWFENANRNSIRGTVLDKKRVAAWKKAIEGIEEDISVSDSADLASHQAFEKYLSVALAFSHYIYEKTIKKDYDLDSSTSYGHDISIIPEIRVISDMYNKNKKTLMACLDKTNAILRSIGLSKESEYIEIEMFPRVFAGERQARLTTIKKSVEMLSKLLPLGSSVSLTSSDFLDRLTEILVHIDNILGEKEEYAIYGTDVREWFDFKIKVHNGDDVKVLANKDSGGETVFYGYVILLACVYNTFGLYGDDNAKGLNTIVIDEAFIKMSPSFMNAFCRVCKRMDLQVIAIHPSDKGCNIIGDYMLVNYIFDKRKFSKDYLSFRVQVSDKQKYIIEQ